MKQDLYTIQEVSSILGVSPKTLRRWEESEIIKPIRTLGNQRRYRLDDIKKLQRRQNLQKIKQQTRAEADSAGSLQVASTPISQNSQPSPSAQTVVPQVFPQPTFVPAQVEQPVKKAEFVRSENGPDFQRFLKPVLGGTAAIVVLFLGAILWQTFGAPDLHAVNNRTSADQEAGKKQQVLAADDATAAFELGVNVPGIFGKRVSFLDSVDIKKGLSVGGLAQLKGGIKTNNANIDAGKGRLTASNIVYSVLAGSNISISGDKQNPTISASVPVSVTSIQGATGAISLANGSGISLDGLTINNTGVLSFQGTTGDVTLSAGNGIDVSGTTITNTDTGTAQNIFKTFSISGTDISASNNNDTINFAAGSGIVLSGDTGSKTITITSNASGTLSGLTTNGVLYATSNTDAGSTIAGTTGTVLHGITGGAPVFSAVDLTADVTGILPYSNGGTGVNTTPTNGEVLIGNGSGYSLAALTQGSGIGIANGSGTITLTNNGVTSLTGTGNEVSVSGATGAISISLPQQIATTSSPSFASLSLTGATNQLVLGSGNTATLTAATLTNNRTYTFPDGSGTFCLVELNNCSGGGGGGIGGSGSQYYIPVFSGGTSLADSDIYDNGKIGIGTTSPQGLFSVSGGVPGLALVNLNATNEQNILTASASGVTEFTIDNNGDLQFTGGSGFLQTLTSTAANGKIYNLPTFTGSSVDICLASGNCSGVGGVIGGSGSLNFIPKFTPDGEHIADSLLYDNGASVGVNTATPVGLLDVEGAIAGKALTILNYNGSDQNILVGSASGSMKFAFDASGNLNLASGSYEIGGINVLNSTTLGANIINSSLTQVGTIISGAWHGTTIGTLYGGTGNDWSGVAQGSMSYFSGIGVMSTFAPGSAGQLLESNGSGSAPNWISTSSVNFWQQNLGTLSPLNITNDLLLGGTSTSSAKFAVLNMAGGTPVASVAGNFIVMPTIIGGNQVGGNVGIGTTNPTGLLTIQGTAANGTEQILNGTNTMGIGFAAAGNVNPFIGSISNTAFGIRTNNTNRITIQPAGFVGINTSNPTAQLDVNGTASVSGQFDLYGTPQIQSTANQTLTLGGATTGDIAFQPGGVSSGSSLYLASNGKVGIGTTSPLSLFSIGSGSSFQVNSSGSITAATGITSSGTIDFSAIGTGVVQSSSGTLSASALNLAGSNVTGILPVANGGTGADLHTAVQGAVPYFSSTGVMGTIASGLSSQCLFGGATPSWGSCAAGVNLWQENLGTLAPANITDDLLLGGTSTASAKFAFINNIGTGTPTASIAGNLSLAVPTGANPATTFNVLNGGSLNFQTSAGGDAGLATRVFIQNGGNVGIGTNNPTAKLFISGTFKSSSTSTNAWQIQNGGGTILFNGDTTNMRLGIGSNNTSPLTTLDVRATSATTAVASVSGASNFANLIVDQSGSGDLFTASKSGVSKFTILNNGNVQINNLAAGVVQSNSSGILSSSALNLAGGLISGQLPVANGGTGQDFSGITQGAIPYFSSTGVMGTIASGLSSQCLFGGATPSWGSCAAGVNLWQENSGAVEPANITDDLLLGATATTSAKFAFSGVANGKTPVASIAATPASGTSTGLALSGAGTIQSLNNTTLTIGGNTTGNIALANNVIQFTGSAPVISSTNTLTINAFTLGGAIAGNGQNITGLGSINGLAITANTGTITSGTWTGTAIGTQYGGTGADFHLVAQGAVPYFSGTGAMSTLAAGTAGQCLETLGASNNPQWANCAQGQNYWQMPNNGAIAPFSSTADVLIGGTATTSAAFAFTGVDGGTPTASISANSGNNATYLTGAGILGTTNKQSLTLGSTTTGNINLAPGGFTALIATASAGGSSVTIPYVGAGSQTAFQVLNNGSQLFTVDTNGAHVIVGTTTTGSCTGSTGRLCVNQSGAASANFTTLNNSTFVTGNSTGGTITNNGVFLTDTSTGAGATVQGVVIDATGSTNASSTINSIIAKVNSAQINLGNFIQFQTGGSTVFDVTNAGTLGVGTNAIGNGALVVNQPNASGDIISASQAGTTKFQLTNAGRLNVVGNLASDIDTLTATKLTIGGTSANALAFGNGTSTTTFTGTGTFAVNSTTINVGNGSNATITTPSGGASLILAANGAGTVQFFNANSKIDSSGNLTINGNLVLTSGATTTFGSTAYNWASATPGSGYILETTNTGVLSWVAPGTLPSSNFWSQVSGVLTPQIETQDLLLGGAATTSAKFAFINNIGAGTPTASISAQSGTNSALILGADGNIQSVKNQTLTIGGNTTGNIVISPNNGGAGSLLTVNALTTIFNGTTTINATSLGTISTAATLTLSGATAVSDTGLTTVTTAGNLSLGSTNNVTFSGTAALIGGTTTSSNLTLESTSGAGVSDFISFKTGNTAERMRIDTNGNVGIGSNFGTLGAAATLDVRGNSGTTPVASVAGTTAKAALVVDNSGVGDIFTASSSGLSRFTVQQNGTIVLGSDNTATPSAVTVRGGQANGSNSSGGNLIFDASNGTGSGGSGNIIFQTASPNVTGTGTPTFDAQNSANSGAGTATTSTISLTVSAAHTNEILIIGVSTNNAPGPVQTVSTGTPPTWNGSQTFTKLTSANYKTDTQGDELWYLVNPATGTHNVNITFTGAVHYVAGAEDFYNVNTSSPFDTVSTNTGATSGAGAISLSVASGTDELPIDVISWTALGNLTPGGAQTATYNTDPDNPGSASTYQSSAGSSTSFTWTDTNATDSWYDIGVSLEPPAPTGGTAQAADAFTQAMIITPTGNIGINDNNPSNTLKVNGSLCVNNASGACSGSTAGTIYAHSTSITAADLAENYVSSQELSPGDVVALAEDGNNNAIVKASSSSATLGIISTDPGVTLNDGAETDATHPYLYPVALSGRVPVKVSSINGSIHAGDPITLSSIPGVAMKATQAGEIIGTALEDYTSDDPNAAGTIMAFANLSWYDPAFTVTDTGNLSIFSNASGIGDTNQLPSFSVKDTNGNVLTENAAYANATVGNLQAGGINAQQINTQDLILAGQSVNDRLNSLENAASNEAQLSSTVTTLSDNLNSLTDRVASLEATLNLLASGSALLNENPADFVASSASQLNLDQLTANNVVVNKSLSVLGKTTVADLGVTGNMTIGLLGINGLNQSDGGGQAFASINTSSGDLMIQSEGLNGVNFLNGKLTIDTNGNLQTQGAVTATKYNVDTGDVAGASLGVGTIPTGATSVIINTSAVTNKSAIFVTPKTPTSQPLSVTTQTTGTSFKVELTSPAEEDIKFNWWIVN